MTVTGLSPATVCLKGDLWCCTLKLTCWTLSLVLMECDLAWGPQEGRAWGKGWCVGGLLGHWSQATGEGARKRETRKEEEPTQACIIKLVTAVGSGGLIPQGSSEEPHRMCLGSGWRTDEVGMCPLFPSPLAKGCPGVLSPCTFGFVHVSAGVSKTPQGRMLERHGTAKAGCCQVIPVWSWGPQQGLQCYPSWEGVCQIYGWT